MLKVIHKTAYRHVIVLENYPRPLMEAKTSPDGTLLDVVILYEGLAFSGKGIRGIIQDVDGANVPLDISGNEIENLIRGVDTNACHDCREDLTNKESHLYGRYKYCTICYDELALVCAKCKRKETDRPEFNTYQIQKDGKLTSIILCDQCTAELTRCNGDGNGCQILVERIEDNRCKNRCRSYFCTMHLKSHECGHPEPKHLFKDFNGRKQPGKVELAISIKNPRFVGVEFEAVDGNPEKIVGLDGRIGLAHDGSLEGNNPIELQTPPASSSQLEELIDNATKVMRSAGFKVNKSCGLHIHLDCSDCNKDARLIFQIISTYYAVEPVIFAMLPKSRRQNKYAQPLRNWLDEIKMLELANRNSLTLEELEYEWYKSRDQEHIERFKNHKWDSSRYHGLNLHSLFVSGHIEMRHHHGTLNATKIKNWINLNLLFFEWALHGYNKNVVEAICLAPDTQSKLRIITRRMGLTRELRRYINRNLKKFEGVEEDLD